MRTSSSRTVPLLAIAALSGLAACAPPPPRRAMPPTPAATAPLPAPAPTPTPDPTPEPTPPPVDAFATTVRPVLFRTCVPCHAPGGVMYGRMPFDQPATIREHKEGILRRLKGADRDAVASWLAADQR